jgi:predicted dienelactone hydrolase
MNLITQPTSSSTPTALGARARSRPRLLAALVAALLAIGVSGPVSGAATAAAGDGPAAELPVGHTVKSVDVRGSAEGERRKVDVHLWYPADRLDASAPTTVYRSALHGRPLIPDRWDPLAWTVEAEIAREGAPIDPAGERFPVIVFSHGSVNDPIDYAHTLERIAAAGFVVAAPYHVNNTQDDVRIDYINAQAGSQLFMCSDGRPGPCARPAVPFSMADRVSDISQVLNRLPAWLGQRADVSRAGVLGHSRGTVAALAAAGGSAAWGPSPEVTCVPAQPSGEHPRHCWPGVVRDRRVKAIMGMAIAVRPITFGAGLSNVEVPSLLVAGGQDETSRQAVSEEAFAQLSSPRKEFLAIPKATHRSFDSTYCDQTQAAGAIAQANPRAILDLHTIRGTLTHPTSGKAIDYCPFATFTSPTDIRPLVASLTGFNVTPDNVPTTGLDSDAVKATVTGIAVDFFGTALERVGND